MTMVGNVLVYSHRHDHSNYRSPTHCSLRRPLHPPLPLRSLCLVHPAWPSPLNLTRPSPCCHVSPFSLQSRYCDNVPWCMHRWYHHFVHCVPFISVLLSLFSWVWVLVLLFVWFIRTRTVNVYFSYSLLPLLSLTLRWPSVLPSPALHCIGPPQPPPPHHRHPTQTLHCHIAQLNHSLPCYWALLLVWSRESK